MIDYVLQDLFLKSSIDKQISITYDGGEITNTDIPYNEFVCNEILCSKDSLVFGSCEANSIEFTCLNNGISLVDKELEVKLTLAGETDKRFNWGKYKVVEDTPSADRLFKRVVAYDAMYEIINADVTEWYTGLEFPLTMKQFRDSFFDYLGVVQVNKTLINDDMQIDKTIEVEALSGKDVVYAICEINGCFGNINRNGHFAYIEMEYISAGLYPSQYLFPSNNLFPREKVSNIYEEDAGRYIEVDYADWRTDKITGLNIISEENDLGVSVGTDDNVYKIVGNFLVYGKEEIELETIARNVFSKIEKVVYQPVTATTIGNPCLEVGDAVSFILNNGNIVNTYVLERSLSGIQAIYDSIFTKGQKSIEKAQNGLNSTIQQLKGKSNVLERNIEETRSAIKNVEEGLSTEITQTAGEIRTEIKDTKDGLELRITQTAEGIEQEISSVRQEIENNVTTYSGSVIPTLSNYPANEWNTDALKDKHVGNIYYVFSTDETINNTSYRFKKLNGVYSWELVTDSLASKAAQDAADALNQIGLTNENLRLNYETTEASHSFVNESFREYNRIVRDTYTTSGDVESITGEKLASYYNKVETDSMFRQTSNEIELTVAGTQSKWLLNGTVPDYNGYGLPDAESKYNGKTFLDVNSGMLYRCVYQDGNYSWSLLSQLKSTEASLQLKVDASDLVSELNASADVIRLNAGKFVLYTPDINIDGDGNVVLGKNATISWESIEDAPDFALESEVPTKISELENDKKYVVDGSNISIFKNDKGYKDYADVVQIAKDTITAPYINSLKITAGSVNANNISAGVISGSDLYGGNITFKLGQGITAYYDGAGARAYTVLASSINGVTGYFYTTHANGGYRATGNTGLFSNDMNANVVRKSTVSNAMCSQIGNNEYDTRIYGKNIYKGSTSTAITSDKRLKKSIKSIGNRMTEFFMKLNPVTYKMRNGESGRLHIGFIAQEVREALAECNIDTQDFAGYVEDQVDKDYLKEAFHIDADRNSEWQDGKQLYVRYEEFIALNTQMIQNQQREIDTLKTEIAELKKMLEKALK